MSRKLLLFGTIVVMALVVSACSFRTDATDPTVQSTPHPTPTEDDCGLVEMAPALALEITIQDAAGNPIPDATVSVNGVAVTFTRPRHDSYCQDGRCE